MLKANFWRKSERGAVAITVALSLLALLAAAAVAINTVRFVYVRQVLQAALDGAMTAAAADALTETVSDSPNSDRMVQIATKYFNANYNLPLTLVPRHTFAAVYRDDATYDDSIVGTVDADVSVELFGILSMLGWNQPSIPIHLESVAQRPRPSPVQMVIALDNTGSMDDPFGGTTKIAALRTAAKGLIAILMQSDYAKVGLVPFSWYIRLVNTSSPDVSKYMNMSTSPPTPNVNWLQMSNQPAPIYDCYAYDRTRCTTTTGTCYRDGVPYTCTLTNCPCTDRRERFLTWDGCVYLRPAPTYNLTIESPTNPTYRGSWSTGGCNSATPITDLVTKGETYRVGSRTYSALEYLNYQIDSLRTNIYGLTYIPAGLIWAWNMMTTNTVGNPPRADDQNYPLNNGFTDDEVRTRKVRKALLLITDGNNTAFSFNVLRNVYDAFGMVNNSNHRTKTENEMIAICNGIKAQQIELYVIGLQVGTDLAYRDLLENKCATGNSAAGYFFDVSTPQGLQDAFNRIGKSLSYNSLVK